VIGEDPNAIRPSMWIKLPFNGSFWYHIEPGDTLFQLAEWVYNHGPNYVIIHQANPWIQDPEQIQPSWWIWVP
jgi:nucleoid-associated protein YgaU